MARRSQAGPYRPGPSAPPELRGITYRTRHAYRQARARWEGWTGYRQERAYTRTRDFRAIIEQYRYQRTYLTALGKTPPSFEDVRKAYARAVNERGLAWRKYSHTYQSVHRALLLGQEEEIWYHDADDEDRH